jgi:hypothetical protein
MRRAIRLHTGCLYAVEGRIPAMSGILPESASATAAMSAPDGF